MNTALAVDPTLPRRRLDVHEYHRMIEAGILQLETLLLHEAPDPNVKRLSLLERIDQGKQWAR